MTAGRKRSAQAASKRTQARARLDEKRRAEAVRRRVVVNAALLRPTNSYGTPDFVARGYYVDHRGSLPSLPQARTGSQGRGTPCAPGRY